MNVFNGDIIIKGVRNTYPSIANITNTDYINTTFIIYIKRTAYAYPNILLKIRSTNSNIKMKGDRINSIGIRITDNVDI